MRLAALALALLAAVPAAAFKGDRLAREDAHRFGLDRLEEPTRRVPDAAVRRAAQDFRAAHGGGWELSYDPRTGAVRSLAGGGTRPRSGRPRDVARQFLQEQRSLLGVDPDALQLERETSGPGHRHLLYKQTYRGLPVEFARVKVHLADDGSITGFNSTFAPDAATATTPLITPEAAASRAVADAGGGAASRPELVILPVPATGRAHLAWKVPVRGPGASWRYYVDARTGQVLFRYSALRFATAGTVTGDVFDLDPNSAVISRPFANQYVYIGSNATRVTTAANGSYNSGTDGKVTMSFQGPFVNVSNFRGPSAHYDNGAGTWQTVANAISSNRPYADNAVQTATMTLPAGAPGFANAVKILPVFTNFNVGSFSGGAGEGGDIVDDDEVEITDGNGAPVASYIGNRGAFNGAAVAGKTLHLLLKSNGSGRSDGYDVSVSSYLVMAAPDAAGAGGSTTHNWTPADAPIGLRSEQSLFYHLNAMHDYFVNGPDAGGFAPIAGPVHAMAFVGPNLVNAFYNPEYDNLMFGDVSSQAPDDLFTEDATVPHHEYVHYVVEKIWSIQNFGQAGAISEGLADFFSAASLESSSIGIYANAGVPLRELDCAKAVGGCPGAVLAANNWAGEIHADSLFISQALWELRKTLAGTALGAVNGKKCAEGITFQSLLSFPESFIEVHDAMRRVAGTGAVGACAGLASATIQSDIDAAFADHGLTGSAGDAYEGTARNDGFETAVDVSTLGAVSATIFPATDADFYTFAAGAGLVKVRMSLPTAGGGYFKAYQLKLFDRSHVLVAQSAPPYNGFSTDSGFCLNNDCQTTSSGVDLLYNNPTGGQLFLEVVGGDTLDGSASAVNGSGAYALLFQFTRSNAFDSSIVTAKFDQDTISFTVNVTTFVSTQDWSFVSAQLRDQSQAVMANTKVTPPAAPAGSDVVVFVSSSGARGQITGRLQLRTGFADRYPAVGTVFVEVFGRDTVGTVASLGVSNPVNLTGNTAELKAFNNVFDPVKGEKATVKYTIAQPGHVTVKLYTLTGRYVATLVDQDEPAGKGSVDWYGRNSNGSVVASGVYLVRITAPGLQQTKKIAVIK